MGSKKNKSSKKKNSKKNVVKNDKSSYHKNENFNNKSIEDQNKSITSQDYSCDTNETLISFKSISIDTASSIEINTQIRQPHNITMISKSNLDSERQSDNLNETDDKSDDLKFNELYKNTLRKSKIVSEASISSDIDHKDLQSISETKSFDIEKIVDIQRDDSALRSCVRNSRSSQDENSSTSKSKSGRKKVVKHPTIDTLKEVDINDDNSQFDSLKNQKNESLQKIKKGYIGREKIKHQLLRPEGLHRSEFWHSYVNEPRSPVYILCRFQIKERKISQERSKKTLIKKVRFYKFVEVKQVTGDSKDRKGNIKLKTQNQAVKIWFTGITRTNTTNNKKPEGNPVVTNIVCEDRTCDIHVFDPFSIEE
ncbi:hypothetical protein RirG_266250 [Rhizophagus irregularis DAOM 197198w]|uniref:Uncharacterized protein n=1 Tax=Rhizophagus irregularis (strain DAOM 197198w) TaxID=1432141 RepID=A0A015L7X2_RHIIW|nr:hypothetical protein RirG_266250 [Rhizophagus irregularis DAOM 197198w]